LARCRMEKTWSIRHSKIIKAVISSGRVPIETIEEPQEKKFRIGNTEISIEQGSWGDHLFTKNNMILFVFVLIFWIIVWIIGSRWRLWLMYEDLLEDVLYIIRSARLKCFARYEVALALVQSKC
jgi:hypothetical protein